MVRTFLGCNLNRFDELLLPEGVEWRLGAVRQAGQIEAASRVTARPPQLSSSLKT